MDQSTLLFFFIIVVVFSGSQASSTRRELLPPEALPTKSGYLPVDPTSSSSSSMFYAFYEAQTPTEPLPQTPLLIWLQGGPGCSSMLGNFLELGPWRVNLQRSLSLRPNPGSWNRLFGLLFLDNPVGTGLSVASTPEDIPKDQAQVARHLFAAITRFIKSNPGFGSRPVYITGESYAGKYVPAIGYHIMKRGSGINLAGVAIGNGLTDPVIQVGTHAASAYFSGLVNERQMRELEAAQAEAIRLTKAGNWSAATGARTRVLNMLQDMTGLATLYDLRRREPYEDFMVEELLRDEGVKRALGAKSGIVFEVCSDSVGKVLRDDVMKSAKYMVEYLVRTSRVLLYQGFFDLRDGVVSTEAWVRTTDWEGIGGFLEAERKVWKVNGELAGYVQRSGSLTNVVVLGAGHLVPADQASNSQAMIEDWVLGRGLFGGVEETEEESNYLELFHEDS